MNNDNTKTNGSLTDEQFLRYTSLINNRTGMIFEENRREMFERRIRTRLHALGSMSPDDYYNHLVFQPDEFDALVNLLVINETRFFREKHHYDALGDIIIPEMIKNKRTAGDYSLRVWSAGCSNGAEAYSLAILISETLDRLSAGDFMPNITATDISGKILDQAQNGVYSQWTLSLLSDREKKNFFTSIGEKEFLLNENIRQLVDFKHHNLTDEVYPDRFDLIFCRNVMIYFEPVTVDSMVKKFYDSLNPDGFLFVGHSESLRDYPEYFLPVHYGEHILYKKWSMPNVYKKGAPCKFANESFEDLDDIQILGLKGELRRGKDCGSNRENFLMGVSNTAKKVIVNMHNLKFYDNHCFNCLKATLNRINEMKKQVVLVPPRRDENLQASSREIFNGYTQSPSVNAALMLVRPPGSTGLDWEDSIDTIEKRFKPMIEYIERQAAMTPGRSAGNRTVSPPVSFACEVDFISETEAVMTLKGKIEKHCEKFLAGKIQEILSSSAYRVFLVLENIAYIDTGTDRLFGRLHAALEHEGGGVIIVTSQDTVKSSILRSKIFSEMLLYNSIDDARKEASEPVLALGQ